MALDTTIVETGTRSYLFTNNGMTSVSILVYKIDESNYLNNPTPTINTYVVGPGEETILAGEDTEFSVPTDGAYALRINDLSLASDDPDKYQTVILYNYPDLRNCLTTIIKVVMCNDSTCCDDCKINDVYVLNKLIALGSTYFMYLQQEYGYINNIYLGNSGFLTQAKIDEMFQIQDVFERMSKLCSFVTGGCSSPVLNSPCGCS